MDREFKVSFFYTIWWRFEANLGYVRSSRKNKNKTLKVTKIRHQASQDCIHGGSYPLELKLHTQASCTSAEAIEFATPLMTVSSGRPPKFHENRVSGPKAGVHRRFRLVYRD